LCIFKINDIIEKSIFLLKKECEHKNIILEQDIQCYPYVNVDPSQLNQVFFNIILNSIHAIENKGTIKISVSEKNSNAYVEISDTGCGIRKEHLGKVFDPFFTTKGPLAGGNIPGTGLGLSTAYGIIESHNGNLEVESTYGKGTTVKVNLPIVRPPELKEDVTERFEEVVNLKGKNALIVDDEESILSLLKKILENKGVNVTCATTGESAIELFKSKRFDLIIMDILMPKLSGLNTASVIKELDPVSKIIFITGRVDSNLEELTKGKGNGFLQKPFSIEEFLTTLDKVINK
jgi:CheY-like chemotaxis protein